MTRRDLFQLFVGLYAFSGPWILLWWSYRKFPNLPPSALDYGWTNANAVLLAIFLFKVAGKVWCLKRPSTNPSTIGHGALLIFLIKLAFIVPYLANGGIITELPFFVVAVAWGTPLVALIVFARGQGNIPERDDRQHQLELEQPRRSPPPRN